LIDHVVGADGGLRLPEAMVAIENRVPPADRNYHQAVKQGGGENEGSASKEQGRSVRLF
jgi:hypothetical protein